MNAFSNKTASLSRDSDTKTVLTRPVTLKAGSTYSLFTYGVYKNGLGTLQTLGCDDDAAAANGLTPCTLGGTEQ